MSFTSKYSACGAIDLKDLVLSLVCWLNERAEKLHLNFPLVGMVFNLPMDFFI